MTNYTHVQILDDGTVKYLDEDGAAHRTDGPAMEHPDGTKEWLIHGYYHREDGPAIKYANGHEEWMQNGELHRIGGPALISDQGAAWYFKGEFHRLDGPAKEYSNGTIQWWVMGKFLYEHEFHIHPLVLEHKRKMNLKNKIEQL